MSQLKHAAASVVRPDKDPNFPAIQLTQELSNKYWPAGQPAGIGVQLVEPEPLAVPVAHAKQIPLFATGL